METINDKGFFITYWRKSVFILVLILLILLLDNSLIIKWVSLGIIAILFGTSRKLRLNVIDQRIDQHLDILGIEIRLKTIPLNIVWEFIVRQDKKNRYLLIAQLTSGEKIVLLREDLKKDIDTHHAALRKFAGI